MKKLVAIIGCLMLLLIPSTTARNIFETPVFRRIEVESLEGTYTIEDFSMTCIATSTEQIFVTYWQPYTKQGCCFGKCFDIPVKGHFDISYWKNGELQGYEISENPKSCEIGYIINVRLLNDAIEIEVIEICKEGI
jgi:hypothetical protein